MSDLGIIIQARLGSKRLPNKMVKPFYNEKGVFEIIILRITENFPDVKVIVATTRNSQDDELAKICKNLNIICFRGSEENVLERFIEAAETYNITKIIRICADNPFLNLEDLGEIISKSVTSNFDYLSFSTATGKPTILTHYGLWAEFVKLNALKKVRNATSENFYYEHVTNYIYTHPKIFNIQLIKINSKIEELPQVRLTLDTEEDFVLLKKIYESLGNFNGSSLDLISSIVKNSNWLEIMIKQIKKNEK
jgi:spore coat polysaccharide biosynthesis protein SpsF